MEKDQVKLSYKNINIEVDITAILSSVDRTLLNVEIGDGFKVCEIFLDEFKDKKKLISKNKFHEPDFILKSDDLDGDEKRSFIAIVKNRKIEFANNPQTLSEEILNDNMEKYRNRQARAINNIILKMRIFKEGAIGVDNILFSCNCPKLDVENKHLISEGATEFCLNNLNTYHIDNNEISEFNKFMASNSEAFSFLMSIINLFNSSYNLPVSANAFDQIIKTNEIMFQVYYKKNLSKRMAVFLGTDANSIWNIYHELKSFFRYRSEITYEVVDIDIIKATFLAFRQYTRQAIMKYINIIDDELELWLSTFESIESTVISNLNHEVAITMRQGILPY